MSSVAYVSGPKNRDQPVFRQNRGPTSHAYFPESKNRLPLQKETVAVTDCPHSKTRFLLPSMTQGQRCFITKVQCDTFQVTTMCMPCTPVQSQCHHSLFSPPSPSPHLSLIIPTQKQPLTFSKSSCVSSVVWCNLCSIPWPSDHQKPLTVRRLE